jgi:hypothetical protein
MQINLLAACLLACAIAAPAPTLAKASHNVKGYVKKNGTYVAPHKQTNPNGTQRDNWTSKPNANPYTGKDGTKEPQK